MSCLIEVFLLTVEKKKLAMDVVDDNIIGW